MRLDSSTLLGLTFLFVNDENFFKINGVIRCPSLVCVVKAFKIIFNIFDMLYFLEGMNCRSLQEILYMLKAHFKKHYPQIVFYILSSYGFYLDALPFLQKTLALLNIVKTIKSCIEKAHEKINCKFCWLLFFPLFEQ